MKSRKEIKDYIADLKAQGIRPFTAAPLVYRMLWFLKINITPPLNQKPVKNGVFLGLFFAGFMGIFMNIFNLVQEGSLSIAHTIMSIIVGVFFGIYMSRHFINLAKNLRIPEWGI